MYKQKIIAIEGTNFSGKYTQAFLLCDSLRNMGIRANLLGFNKDDSSPIRKYVNSMMRYAVQKETNIDACNRARMAITECVNDIYKQKADLIIVDGYLSSILSCLPEDDFKNKILLDSFINICRHAIPSLTIVLHDKNNSFYERIDYKVYQDMHEHMSIINKRLQVKATANCWNHAVVKGWEPIDHVARNIKLGVLNFMKYI